MLDFNNMIELNVGLLSFSILVTAFIFIGCLFDKKQRKAYMKNFIVLLAINMLMQAGELGIWVLGNNKEAILGIKICSFFSFGGGTVMVVVYGYCLLAYVREKEEVSYKMANIIAIICGIYLLMVFVSVFNGILFTVDAQGNFVYGSLYLISWVLDPLLLIVGMGLIIYYRKYLGKVAIFSMIGFSILFLGTMIMQQIWYPVPEMLMTTLSLILVFMFFYGEQTKQLAEKDKKLVESQVEVAVSQIQPHFLYNTLSAIAQLCKTDPDMAEEVTMHFAKYLRRNLENMGQPVPVGFHSELEHVKTYLWIEKVRFQEDLNVVYDIETEDFSIPSLTVQPFAENAVKHGMMGMEEGVCTVTIATRDYEDYVDVIISDDGCGFDTEVKSKDDGRKHIGIKSVRSRIELMSNGKIKIDSAPGMGTTVTITLPKE